MGNKGTLKCNKFSKTATKLRAERRSVDEVKYTADIETQARLEILLKGSL